MQVVAIFSDCTGSDMEHKEAKRQQLQQLVVRYDAEPRVRGTVVVVVRQSLETALLWLEVVRREVNLTTILSIEYSASWS